MKRPRVTTEVDDVAERAALTVRETEVLVLVASNYSNPEIAERLTISKRTVESHIAALLRKRCVSSRAELIRAITADERAKRVPGRQTSPLGAPVADEPTEFAVPHVHSVALRDRERRQQTREWRKSVLEPRIVEMHKTLADRLEELATHLQVTAARAPDQTARLQALLRAERASNKAASARLKADLGQQLLDQMSSSRSTS